MGAFIVLLSNSTLALTTVGSFALSFKVFVGVVIFVLEKSLADFNNNYIHFFNLNTCHLITTGKTPLTHLYTLLENFPLSIVFLFSHFYLYLSLIAFLTYTVCEIFTQLFAYLFKLITYISLYLFHFISTQMFFTTLPFCIDLYQLNTSMDNWSKCYSY